MLRKKSKTRKPVIEKENQVITELSDMKLDEMDFEVVKKVLSDFAADVDFEESELDAEFLKDQKFLELIVESLDEGLKKASQIFEIQIKELKYKIIEKVYKEVDGEDVPFQRIEFQKKLITGQPQIKIIEDKLSAYFSIVFPKIDDDVETDEKHLFSLIKGENITYGIQKKEINEAVKSLKINYDAMRNVLIAKGESPTAGKDCEIYYSVFSKLEEINYEKKHEKYLIELLNSSSLETLKENYFPVTCVAKGELIASTTEPGNGEEGKDIFGNVIEAEKGSFLYQASKNVTMKFEGGHVNYYSDIYGYVEYDDKALSVHSPVWVSEDLLQAYFVALPRIKPVLKKLDSEELYDQLYKKEVKYGVITESIEKIIDSIKRNENDFSVILVAEGEREQKGEDAKVELFFDEEVRPGKILEDGRIDYREIDVIKTVKNNQLIAAKYPPKEGVPGKNLKGETIPAPQGDDKKLNTLNNVRAAKGEGRTLYYSTIEGRVVLFGDSSISVNQVYEIEGNVDYSTGNIDFNGDVQINGSVISGFRVKAEGNITIKGTINQDVELISNGNISVKQGVIGRNQNTRLKAKGSVLAQFVQSADIESDADIVIKDYIMNSDTKAKGYIISPDRKKTMIGTGSIVGGDVTALKGVIVNSLGSDFAKMTKIMAGVDFEFEQTVKNLNKGIEYCDYEVSKLSKVLKLGFQDLDTLKMRIAKLPKKKQLPFLEALKKLNEVNQLRNDIIKKRDKYFADTDKLSQNADIVVKKELYPRVHIQIGEAKLVTNELYTGLSKLKESKNRKNIVFVK